MLYYLKHINLFLKNWNVANIKFNLITLKIIMLLVFRSILFFISIGYLGPTILSLLISICIWLLFPIVRYAIIILLKQLHKNAKIYFAFLYDYITNITSTKVLILIICSGFVKYFYFIMEYMEYNIVNYIAPFIIPIVIAIFIVVGRGKRIEHLARVTVSIFIILTFWWLFGLPFAYNFSDNTKELLLDFSKNYRNYL